MTYAGLCPGEGAQEMFEISKRVLIHSDVKCSGMCKVGRMPSKNVRENTQYPKMTGQCGHPKILQMKIILRM